MLHWREREERKAVRVEVRVRTDAGWIDATVRNVSSRGMMLHSLQPLDRNQFVEIARGRYRVVGRIVWTNGPACGLQSQDCVDICLLLAERGGAGSHAPGPPPNDRRIAGRRDREPAPIDLQFQAETARLSGKAFEGLALLGAAISAAALIVAGVYDLIADPFEMIDMSLGSSALAQNLPA